MTDQEIIQKGGQWWLGSIIAVILALGILLPPILYGVLLHPRWAGDVLVAVGVCLFSALVYLWTLHAISVITFRDAWMSKAIFGAAITGILGTSVIVFRTQLATSFPFEGRWEFHLERVVDNNVNCVWAGQIMIVNNTDRNAYMGLAGDNQDDNDTCFYGVKDVRDIEWNDRDTPPKFSFFLVNFPKSASHPSENASPTSPLIVQLRQEGNDWFSVVSKEKTSSTPFRISLKRL
jgi:hypothetical protein